MDYLERLKDKAIIVVGSGSGIGEATAQRLAAEGARVCLADIALSAAQGVAEGIEAAGGTAFATYIDLADEASVDQAVRAAVARFGRLDGAHINAADMVTLASDTTALDEDMAVFDRTLQVNLRGHLLCTRAILPHFRAGGGGAIVYTSSGAADAGEPVRPAYAIAKAGINALMRHVASAWGREGITANCVAPGLTITNSMKTRAKVTQEFQDMMLARTPNQRLGQPDDIAGMVAMLLSEDGRWMNGKVFEVDGGASN